jgi:8-oxo-dGTP pyrophosphatase MutT (NUDIX family)
MVCKGRIRQNYLNMKLVYLDKPADFNPKMEVVSCFVEHEGKLLLLHRQDHRPQGNTWAVPAGKVEKGEEIGEAMCRELNEEILLPANVSDLIYFRKVYLRYPEFDFVYHMYRLQLISLPNITLNLDEYKDFKWVTPNEALNHDLIPGEDECIRLFYKIKNSPEAR